MTERTNWDPKWTRERAKDIVRRAKQLTRGEGKKGKEEGSSGKAPQR